MDTLAKLFGNAAKVKVMKLFIFNPETAFDVKETSSRIKETPSKTRKELSLLEKIGLIKKRVYYKTVIRKVRGKKTEKKIKTSGWVLNHKCDFLLPLQAFLVKMNHFGSKYISSRLGRSGTIKLIIVAGVFIQEPESRVDLLIVGDNLKKGVLDNAVKTIEADMGREITYAAFETPEFIYRVGIYDKLVRDILDFPHEKVLDRMGLE